MVSTFLDGRYLDVKAQQMPRNDSESHLTFLVIHQRTGKILFRKIFPLRKFYSVWYDLDRHLVNVTPGRLVYLYVEGDAILGLRNATFRMVSYGSILLRHLNLSSNFMCIFVRGGKILYEGAAFHKTSLMTSSMNVPVFAILPEDLTFDDYGYKASFDATTQESKRWDFCNSQGVMGDLCDESDPYDINLRDIALPNYIRNSSYYTDISDVPIIVTAGKRIEYLYQSLKSYLRAPGVIKNNLIYILGNHHSQTVELLEIFNISYFIISPTDYGKSEFLPFYYYREVYDFAHRHFGKKSNYVIFLEEDVEIELDFFSYFSQTVHLLDKDPTLYCITSHSSTGLKGLGYDESQVFRSNVQVGWGYALSMSFIKEILPQWKAIPDYHILKDSVFDGWIYNNIRKERECVFPEISRIRHFGIGMNTDYWLAERTFLSLPTTQTEIIPLVNLDRIPLEKYDNFLIRAISKSQTITNSPCAKNFTKGLKMRGSWVIFYHRNISNEVTHKNFYAIGNCFKIWTFSEQGQHKGVAIVRLSLQQTFYLVAVPDSPFSFLLPKGVVPMDINNMSHEEIKDVLAKEQEMFLIDVLYEKHPTSGDIMEVIGNQSVSIN